MIRAAAVAWGLIFLGVGSAVAQPEPPQNVVLVVIDTLRADRVEARRNGVPLMPGLRRLSRESWVFTNTVSAASWTKPSMVSLFTSLYPQVHNVQWGLEHSIVEGGSASVDVLPEAMETLATCLQKAGYRTVALQCNSNMHPRFGVSQGFDFYAFHPYPETRGKELTDMALDVLEGLKEPYFLYVHYMDPHQPYDPPAVALEGFGAAPAINDQDRALFKEFTGFYLDKVLFDVGVNPQRKVPDLSPAGREYLPMLYDGAVRYVDAEVERLLKRVRQRSPRTIVAVTSDHGEELWDHGSLGHGKTVYQELLRVPLILQLPDRKPRRIDAPVQIVDLLPTIAAQLGLPPRPEWQGKNLLEPLTELRPVFAQTKTAIREANVDLRSVEHDGYKLIVDSKNGTRHLYRLKSDPAEQHDVSADEPGVVDRLSALLAKQDAANAAHPSGRYAPGTGLLDPETAEILKSQGYLR